MAMKLVVVVTRMEDMEERGRDVAFQVGRNPDVP